MEAGKKMLADMSQDLTSGHRSGVSSDGHRSVVSRRCERGRVPSDSSSGISDDSSSNSSGSDRDSGIETGDTGAAGLGSWPGINTTGVPVTFGLDHDERSLDSEDREKIRETLEIGVRKLNLVGKHKNQGERTLNYESTSIIFTVSVQEISPRKTRSSWSGASTSESSDTSGDCPESPVRLKLLLRKKRSPILDDVLSEGRESDDPPIIRSDEKIFRS